MNGQQLLNIAEAGLHLTEEVADEQGKTCLLIVLLDIEDALDKGRRLAPFSDLKGEINKKMDELRTRIRNLINEMDKNEVRELLEKRAESLRFQFTV